MTHIPTTSNGLIDYDSEGYRRLQSEVSSSSEAFVTLYKIHVSSVFSYFAWKFGRPSAEDLTSDVFMRAYEQRHKFDRDRSWKSWVFGIARNRALEFARNRNRVHKLSPMDNEVPGADIEVSIAESVDWVSQLVNSLNPAQRELIELRFWGELSFKEIAELVRSNEGAVRVRVHRILKILKSTGEIT